MRAEARADVVEAKVSGAIERAGKGTRIHIYIRVQFHFKI